MSAALIDLTLVWPNLGRMRFSGRRSYSCSVVGEIHHGYGSPLLDKVRQRAVGRDFVGPTHLYEELG